MKMVASAVAEEATQRGLPLLQPKSLKDATVTAQLRAIDPDAMVVAAYGLILPPAVLAIPRFGCLNIHGSVLPRWRGAAPVQRAIEAGDTETGITIMQMVPALDAGPMLHVLRTSITGDETYGELHDRMSELGAQAIVQALALVGAGASRAIAQDDALSTYAPKIDREMGRLEFAATAVQVSRLTRAFDPKPGAFATLNGTDVKLFGAHVVGDGSDNALDDPTRSSPPGTVRSADDRGLLVRCGVGGVLFDAAQPSGRPRLAPAAWARGRGVKIGDQFGATLMTSE